MIAQNFNQESSLEFLESLYDAAIEAIEDADYRCDMDEVERIGEQIDLIEAAINQLLKR